ncbi:MAG: methyltransferase domain-containing protein [Bacteroidota bacterium]|jgi:ubiquinone/menaquinone biosynthesis C-methylase UbiE
MFNLFIRKVVRARSLTVIDRIFPYIKISSKIIDIGSGTGDVAFLLQQKGKDITPVDVADFHGPRLMKTVIYDGKKLPFPNKSFDTALLLMVLHHTPDPEAVFVEAARVAKEIVIIETSFINPVHKFFTVIADAIGNLRLEAFWNSYKLDEEWKTLFQQKGFQIISTQKYIDRDVVIPFLHILYSLKRK